MEGEQRPRPRLREGKDKGTTQGSKGWVGGWGWALLLLLLRGGAGGGVEGLGHWGWGKQRVGAQ